MRCRCCGAYSFGVGACANATSGAWILVLPLPTLCFSQARKKFSGLPFAIYLRKRSAQTARPLVQTFTVSASSLISPNRLKAH